MNQQRTVIYNQRREVLDGLDMHEKIVKMINDTIDSAVASFATGENPSEWNFDGLRTYFYGLLCGDKDFKYSEDELKTLTQDDLTKLLKDRAMAIYKSKETLFTPEQLREIERAVILHNVDLKWMDHLDAMDDLRDSIGLQAYAQRNPISEYRIAGADMFDEMIAAIREDTVRNILMVVPRREEVKRVEVAKVTGEGFAGDEKRKPVTVKKSTTVSGVKKVGRNDPCPCGSGKKYKKCCGRNEFGESGDQ